MGLADLFKRKKENFDEEILRYIQRDKAEALRSELDEYGLWEHWQAYEALTFRDTDQTTIFIQEMRTLLAITIEAGSPNCTRIALERTDISQPIAVRMTVTSVGECSKKEILEKGFKRVHREERMLKPFVEEWIRRMETLLLSVRSDDAKQQKRVRETLDLLRQASSFDLPEFLKR